MRLHWGNSYSVSAAMLHFCPFPHNILRTAQKGFREELNFNKAGTIVVGPFAAVKRQACFCAQAASWGSFPFGKAEAELWYGRGLAGPRSASLRTQPSQQRVPTSKANSDSCQSLIPARAAPSQPVCAGQRAAEPLLLNTLGRIPG